MTAGFALIFMGATLLSSPIDPIETFRQICMDGEGRFAPGTVREIDHGNLPQAIRSRVKRESRTRLLMGNGVRQKVFISVEPGPRANGSKHCRVFAEHFDRSRLPEIGLHGLKPDVLKSESRAISKRQISWRVLSRLGYVLGADAIGREGMELQSIVFSDEQAKQMLADEKIAQESIGTAHEIAAARARYHKGLYAE